MLKEFYKDKQTKEEVKKFLLDFIKDKAGDMALSGEDTKHIKQARDIIDQAWNHLEVLFSDKDQKPVKNKAR